MLRIFGATPKKYKSILRLLTPGRPNRYLRSRFRTGTAHTSVTTDWAPRAMPTGPLAATSRKWGPLALWVSFHGQKSSQVRGRTEIGIRPLVQEWGRGRGWDRHLSTQVGPHSTNHEIHGDLKKRAHFPPALLRKPHKGKGGMKLTKRPGRGPGAWWGGGGGGPSTATPAASSDPRAVREERFTG